MAKQTAVAEISSNEEKALDALSLDNAVPVSDNLVFGSVQDLASPEEGRYGPPMHSDKWQDFVMSQFTESEKTSDGNPYVHGLRRLVRKLLGPIIWCGPEENSAIHFVNDQPVVSTRCVLRILWSRPEDLPENGQGFVVTFTDLADATAKNTDAKFIRYPTAMASTRAEGRCLRKALQIKKAAAEELTEVPLEPEGKIKESTIIFLDSLAKRLNINVMKFVNMGKTRYDSIDDVSDEASQKMSKHISSWQTDPSKIDNKLKGYDPNWRNTKE